MINVNITMQRILIENHYRGQVEMLVQYNESGLHEMKVSTKLDNHEEVVLKVLKAIREEVKKRNRPDKIGDDILTDTVIVNFTQDEDDVAKKMKLFLGKAYNIIRSAPGQTSPTAYLNTVNKIKGMEIEF